MNARMIIIRLLFPVIFLVATSCDLSTDLTTGLNDYNYDLAISLNVSLSTTGYFNNDKYDVTITTNKSGAQIYYTLDGQEPTPSNGTLYTAPIVLDSSAVVKAIAYYDGNVSETGLLSVTVTADGSENFPYHIANINHLHNLATLVNDGNGAYNDKFYVQIADIDLSAYSTGTGWTPIGTSNPFRGSYNGQYGGVNHTISGLVINNSSGSNQGLFGYTVGATLNNIHITGASATGNSGVGSLAGYIQNTTVTGCSATATITGSSMVGGLIGAIDTSTVNNCNTSASVNGTIVQTGGFAGYIRYSTVTGCNSGATVDSQGLCTGGFAGEIYTSVIENCYADGGVEADGSNTGGFAGYVCGEAGPIDILYTTISGCHSTANVNSSSSNTGGFIGNMELYSKAEKCHSTGDFSANGENIGGFAGRTYNAAIEKCYSLANVTAYSDNAGGFTGKIDNYSKIDMCYSAGSVTSTGKCTGGFAGYISGDTLSNSYSISAVSSSGLYYGGFLGMDGNPSTLIKNCYYAGTITPGVNTGGGFIGIYTFQATIIDCFWLKDSTINATFNDTTGSFSEIFTGVDLKTVGNMQNQTTYPQLIPPSTYGWDFSVTPIWYIDSTKTINSGYPYLNI